jgi:hypothetical protein
MRTPTPHNVAGEQEGQNRGPVILHQLWWHMRPLFSHAACQLPMGRTHDKSVGPRDKLCLARHQPHPWDKLCLVRARLRLPTPRESRMRPLLQLCRAHLRILKRARPWPRADFHLARARLRPRYLQWKGTQRHCKLQSWHITQRAFCPTQYCVNHYGMGNLLVGGGLGTWPSPRP